MVIAVYVDDFLVTRYDEDEITDIKSSLHTQFQIKDLGQIHYFLGLEFNKISNGMIVHQQKYIKELLQSYSLSECAPVSMPLPSKLSPSSDMDIPLEDSTIYRQLIGKLNFLVHTRPDIVFSV